VQDQEQRIAVVGVSVVAAIFLALAVRTVAIAHGGGLDGNGGHYNRKTGEYHYHRGGPSYDSDPEPRYVAPKPKPKPKPKPVNIKGYILSGSTWILGQSIEGMNLKPFEHRQADGWDFYIDFERDLQLEEKPVIGDVTLFVKRDSIIGIQLRVPSSQRSFSAIRDYYSKRYPSNESYKYSSSSYRWSDDDGDSIYVHETDDSDTLIMYQLEGSSLPEIPAPPVPAPEPSQWEIPDVQPAPFIPTPELSDAYGYDVLRIIDGDTFVIQYGSTEETVRLIGVDTPETVHPTETVQAYGLEASAFLHNLLAGERVVISMEADDRDKYGRLLGYAWRLPDGLFVNAEIIRQGYGHAEVDYPCMYMEQFKELQRRAAANGKGLWR
jgi:micrococcal nuclease